LAHTVGLLVIFSVCVGRFMNEIVCMHRVKRRKLEESITGISSFSCRSVTRPSATSARNRCSTSRRYSVKVRVTVLHDHTHTHRLLQTIDCWHCF